MRLVCPNCSAQYEVDAALLPSEGTDVQCSACSTVWFQPGSGGSVETDTPARAPTRPARDARPRSAEQVEKPPRARPVSDPSAEMDDKSAPAPPSSSRALDPSVADVLREEAEFEAKQRARDGSSLETQQELGLFGPLGSDPPDAAARSAASSFPDIDDISSTLEPIDTARNGRAELPQTDVARRRSFVSGLAVPLILAALLVGLYVLAPTLSQALPALEGPLGTYVGLVDAARASVARLFGLSL